MIRSLVALGAALLGFLILAVAVSAQTPPLGANEVYVGQSFQVAATQTDPANVTEYRLYRAGARVATLPASARNATTGEFTFPVRTETAASTGVLYEVAAAAVNTTGEAESARLPITVVVKLAPPTTPATPSLPKIIKLPAGS
jgi:hypothetical protein